MNMGRVYRMQFRQMVMGILLVGWMVLGGGQAEGKPLVDVELTGPVATPEVRTDSGKFESHGPGSGWKSTTPSQPADKVRKDGILLDLNSHKPLLSEKGTISFWLSRSRENGGSGYGALLSLNGDNAILLNLYLVWEDKTAGMDNAATAVRISGEGYVKDGASVFGRNVVFDRVIREGEWVHLAITWGPNGAQDNRMYLNGREAVLYLHGVDSALRTGNFGTYLAASKTTVVGSSLDGQDTFYRGVIGGIAVFDTVENRFDLSRYRPKIQSLTDNFLKAAGISGALVAGDTLRVRLEAEPGGTSTCDIGDAHAVRMIEDPNVPGTYTVDYVIQPGNNLVKGRVVGHFANVAGVEAGSVESSSGDISIDSRSRFALTIDKTDLPADSASKARVKVKVTDANGNPIKDHRIKVTLSTTDEYTGLVGGGSPRSRDIAAAAQEQLAGAEVETRWKGITDSWGEVEFDFTSGFAAKTIILQAKDLTSGDVGVDYITSYKEASIDIALTPPVSRAAARRGVIYILKVEASRTELTADGRSRSVIRATLMDPNGTPVPGDPVAFSLSSANGTLRVIRDVTDSSGVATAEYIAGKKIGIVVVTATATLRNVSGNVSITLLSDAPAKIYLKARPESLPADGFSRADIAVKVTDVNDNPNKDTKVEFRVAKGGGKIENAERVTDTFGDTSNRYTAGTTPGIATVVATVRSKVPKEEELAKARNVLFVPYSEEGEEIKVSRWLKKVGENALKGEPIVEYTVGRSDTARTLNAPYDCRIDFRYVEYWDTARTGDTLALITPVSIPGSAGQAPAAPSLSPRRR